MTRLEKQYKALTKKHKRLLNATSSRDLRAFIKISQQLEVLQGRLEKNLKEGF